MIIRGSNIEKQITVLRETNRSWKSAMFFKLGYSDLGWLVPIRSSSRPGIYFLYLNHVEKLRQKKEKAIIFLFIEWCV